MARTARAALSQTHSDSGQRQYVRHRPEQTLLYRLIEQYYPAFVDHLARRGQALPGYVQREFEAYLKCGRLEYGFLRVRCEDCHAEHLVAFSCKKRGFCPSCGARRMVESAAWLVDEVLPHLPMRQWVLSFPFQLRFLFARRPEVMTRVLAIVYRAIETNLVHRAGQTRNTARSGAVTLIQRFGSALNLNIHFHMLFLDGVVLSNESSLVFHRLPPPGHPNLQTLMDKISRRIGAYLEREGLLVRDMENDYLNLDVADESALDNLIGHSITYRIAFGPGAGRKAFTLQTVPARQDKIENPNVALAAGFSLHADIATKAHQRHKLERLCRYIARPAVSEKRLSLSSQGQIHYQLKTPYRDGTTHVILEPLDFIARLAALIPVPRVNLTRFHGVFAPNSKYRKRVTPANRAKRVNSPITDQTERHTTMAWAQRLKRVFGIDIKTCSRCGGKVKIIAAIEDPAVIDKILDHLQLPTEATAAIPHSPRAPPTLHPLDGS